MLSKDAIGTNIKNVIPQIKELLFTSRSKVEVLKIKCLSIEKEFQQSREELKKYENKLEIIKRDLQTLYTLRANEYLKPKQEQNVKEINENENRLNEQERQIAMSVTTAREREEGLFELIRSSNDLLYQTSLVYANRFIILGVAIGTGLMGWRAWTTIRERGVTPPPIGTTPPSNNDGIRSDTIIMIQDMNKDQQLRFNEFQETLEQNNIKTTREMGKTIDRISIRIDECLQQRTMNNVNGQFDQTLAIFVIGIVGGIVGATVALVFAQR